MADTKIPSEEPESNVNNEQEDDVTIPNRLTHHKRLRLTHQRRHSLACYDFL